MDSIHNKIRQYSLSAKKRVKYYQIYKSHSIGYLFVCTKQLVIFNAVLAATN